MKIFYDYQILTSQRYGGISKYHYELIRHLNQKQDVATTVVVKGNINEYFKDFFGPIGKPQYGYRKKLLENSNKLLTLAELQKGYDIVHPTYYAPYLLKYASKNRIVITIHDMIQELYPQFLGGKDRLEQIVSCKKQYIYGADAIIAISESTKNDILQLYPEVEGKISVVYHGVSNVSPIKTNFDLPKRYILFVGNRNGYKNFEIVLNAYEQLLTRYSDLYLICVGGGKFSKEEMERISRYQDRIIQCFCNEGELAYIYQNAEAFVFPSIYEGFGMPILEAFTYRCPVLLSDNKCFKEIAGDAAVYFDPSKSEELTVKIRSILDQSEIKKKMVAKGLQQVKKYNWEKTAEETFKVYEQTICQ